MLLPLHSSVEDDASFLLYIQPSIAVQGKAAITVTNPDLIAQVD